MSLQLVFTTCRVAVVTPPRMMVTKKLFQNDRAPGCGRVPSRDRHSFPWPIPPVSARKTIDAQLDPRPPRSHADFERASKALEAMLDDHTAHRGHGRFGRPSVQSPDAPRSVRPPEVVCWRRLTERGQPHDRSPGSLDMQTGEVERVSRRFLESLGRSDRRHWADVDVETQYPISWIGQAFKDDILNDKRTTR